MKNKQTLGALGALTLTFLATSAMALPPQCAVHGYYGYSYEGSTVTPAGEATFTETGRFRINLSNRFVGSGQLVFKFQDFAGQGPLWLHVEETVSNGYFQPDQNPDNCSGTATFQASATVIQSSNPTLVAPGTVFYVDQPRSMAWTASGYHNSVDIDMVSTSPGTLASGHARRRYVQ